MRTAVIYIILFCEVNRATNIYYPLALPEAWTELLQHKADGSSSQQIESCRTRPMPSCVCSLTDTKLLSSLCRHVNVAKGTSWLSRERSRLARCEELASRFLLILLRLSRFLLPLWAEGVLLYNCLLFIMGLNRGTFLAMCRFSASLNYSTENYGTVVLVTSSTREEKNWINTLHSMNEHP